MANWNITRTLLLFCVEIVIIWKIKRSKDATTHLLHKQIISDDNWNNQNFQSNKIYCQYNIAYFFVLNVYRFVFFYEICVCVCFKMRTNSLQGEHYCERWVRSSHRQLLAYVVCTHVRMPPASMTSLHVNRVVFD